jgi:hypothetical protein
MMKQDLPASTGGEAKTNDRGDGVYRSAARIEAMADSDGERKGNASQSLLQCYR